MAFSFPTKARVLNHVKDYNNECNFDDEDNYFLTYVPLSCFPTPPTSCHTSSPREPALDSNTTSSFDTNLQGSATYLSYLIPCTASLLLTSPSLAQSLLSRANLTLNTVALAACILDSLTSRFAASWRHSLPLTSLSLKTQHINYVRPEVIILGALLVASKFLDDYATHISSYEDDIANGRWTCEQINATERCILENLEWRIMPLWREDLIEDAKEDMRKVGMVVQRRRQSSALTQDTTTTERDH
ncbi:hypothetical protein V502_08849 [Pseudogymnoascus sp. VKM F-4520 (FW-2644)]|nr:hypothetical protein V502_08849 [Pseudogymnoascus sp. VKM F-4520 (FW-2644)]